MKREIIELGSSSEEEDNSVVKRTQYSQRTQCEKSVPSGATQTPAEARRALMANALAKRVSNPNMVAQRVDEALGRTENKGGEALVKEEAAAAVSEATESPLRSQIRLFTSPDYCSSCGEVDGDKDTLSMGELMGSPLLVHSYQFNLMIDMAFVTSFVNANNVKFTLVNQAHSDYLHIPDPLWERFQIHSIDASKNLGKYGSHHTKMMVNFFADKTCQLVIHTMNLTQADYILQTQMAWVSPRLEFDASRQQDIMQKPTLKQTGILFKRDLLRYLGTYGEPEINELMEKLRSYNFDPVDVVFVGSAPGTYKYHDKEQLKTVNAGPCFGYGRLWQVIQQHGLAAQDGTFVAQMSSIGGPFDGYKRNIFVHLLTSCVEQGYPLAKRADYEFVRGKGKVEPVVVWPTEEEILSNFGGPQSGRALFYTTEGKWTGYKRQAEVLRKYLHHWRAPHSRDRAKRGHLSPHAKTYTLTQDRFKTLKWFLLTSANLSHQAWGKPAKFDAANKTMLHYEISSYEAGVMIVPKLTKAAHEHTRKVLVPVYGRDTLDTLHDNTPSDTLRIPLRLPYDTPLEKYKDTECPWARPGAQVHL